MPAADKLPFNVLLLEGSFFFSAHNGCLYAQDECGKALSVEVSLLPYVGQRVRFAAHRLPPQPPYQQTFDLFSVSAEGILRAEPVEQPAGLPTSGLRYKWSLETFDGSLEPLALERLGGHAGRLACVSLVDAEAMRDIVSAAGVDVLGVQAENLSDLLGHLGKQKV